MLVLALEINAYYNIKVKGVTVPIRARYIGQGMFLAENKSYSPQEVEEIIQKLPS